MQCVGNFGCFNGLIIGQNSFCSFPQVFPCTSQMKSTDCLTLNQNLYHQPSIVNCHNVLNCTKTTPIQIHNVFSSNKAVEKSSYTKNIDKSKKKKAPRRKFSPEEDEELKRLVEKMGSKKWELIAKEMPGRTGRQCRDRYQNYLIPGFFNGQWSKQEDELLLCKYQDYGSQWSKMAQFFENRSANALKNRWNYFVSRHINENYIEAKIKSANISNNLEETLIYSNKCENKANDDDYDDDDEVYENIINYTSSLAFIDLEPVNENDDLSCKNDYSEFPYISNGILIDE